MAYTTIDNPALFFETLTWTGDGTSPRTLSGLQFQPDWVWGKRRDDAAGHNLFDSVRTAGSNKNLQSNGNGAEGSGSPGTYGYLSAFTSDGFTVTAGSSDNAYWNNNTATYVSWNWLAGGSTSSNSDGSITSTVSANTTAGFSIVSYTGTGSAATVGHGLGAAPSYIIIKDRDNSRSWIVGADDIGWGNYMSLDATDASASLSSIWNSTAPTSTVFSVGTAANTNNSASKLIAYCFAEKKGYSKIGSYIGGSNPFVYLGFKPSWIIFKNKNSSENWRIVDNKRDTDNPVVQHLYPNTSGAEGSGTSYNDFIDFLSNGFKIRSGSGEIDPSGDRVIYMAFAENPFVTAGTKAAGTAR